MKRDWNRYKPRLRYRKRSGSFSASFVAHWKPFNAMKVRFIQRRLRCRQVIWDRLWDQLVFGPPKKAKK